MQANHQNSSEVAQLLAQIEANYLAAQNGLTGFAECAKHAFITARLENMQRCYTALHATVGDEAAKLMEELLEKIPEQQNVDREGEKDGS